MRGCPARSASDRHDYFVGFDETRRRISRRTNSGSGEWQDLPRPHEADGQWPKTRCPRIYRFLSIRPKPNLDTRGVSSPRITTEWILGVDVCWSTRTR